MPNLKVSSRVDSLLRFAHKFKIKTAQGDPWAEMDSRSQEDKDLGWSAVQALILQITKNTSTLRQLRYQ